MARLNAWRNFSSNGVNDSFRRPDLVVFFVGAPKAEIEIGAEAAMIPKPAPTKNFLLSISYIVFCRFINSEIQKYHG